jgi:hypothetical protein
VSSDVRKRLLTELSLLDTQLDKYKDLLRKACDSTPTHIEIAALSALLHSHYSGMENAFKRIALDFDHLKPASGAWHKEILNAMSHATGSRPPVIDGPLRKSLFTYLEFRHLFRHGYTMHLDWDRLSELVKNFEPVHEKFKNAIEVFIQFLDEHSDTRNT